MSLGRRDSQLHNVHDEVLQEAEDNHGEEKEEEEVRGKGREGNHSIVIVEIKHPCSQRAGGRRRRRSSCSSCSR